MRGRGIRVYLPLTADQVQDLHGAGRTAAPAGFTVTEALRRALPQDDDEGLEYAALLAAAAAAGRARGSAVTRRVIAAADLPEHTVQVPQATDRPDPAGPAAVSVTAAVALRQVVSFHVDEHAGGTDDTDLMWWDVTELAAVAEQV